MYLFDYELLRGCRAKKVESMHFDAFNSENYPPLAKAGVKIDYNLSAIRSKPQGRLEVLSTFVTGVAILKIFPGMSPQIVSPVVNNPAIKALVIETFGSGNAPSAAWFIDLLKKAIDRGLLILNVSQCPGGMVIQGKYETSKALQEIGVISGADMTIEAAVTKLMLLLGEYGPEKVKEMIGENWVGELSEL